MPYAQLIDFIERAFILDRHTSSLDFLPDAQGNVYKNFQWHRYDYVGGPKGPNEKLANEMKMALNRIRPERRPHIGQAAILTKKQYNSTLENYIVSQLEPIPDFAPESGYKQPKGEKLNQY